MALSRVGYLFQAFAILFAIKSFKNLKNRQILKKNYKLKFFIIFADYNWFINFIGVETDHFRLPYINKDFIRNVRAHSKEVPE